MPTSEIRKEAREALKGRWGKGVCIVLAYLLISFIVGFVEGLAGEGTLLYSIIDIAYAIISIPLSFGFLISFIKLKRGEEVSAFGFLNDAFSRFGKSWGIWWHTFIRVLLPIICIFLIVILFVAFSIFSVNSSSNTISTVTSTILSILGIVLYLAIIVYAVSRSLLYVLAHYISYDNPEMSSKECVLKSAELMKGNRGNYILLDLSFIGWVLLAALSLYIGFLWLIPYLFVSMVCFYERVAKITSSSVEPLENVIE